MTTEQIIEIVQRASASFNYSLKEGIIFYDYNSDFLNLFNVIIKELPFYIDVDFQDSILVKFESEEQMNEFIIKLESAELPAQSYQLTIINQQLEGDLDNV